MAQGDRTPKKFGQTALNTTPVTVVTGESGRRKELLKIFIANTSSSTRKVTLYAYGTAAANTLVQQLQLDPFASTLLTDTGIVLLSGETFSAKQDAGTDVTITVLGIEEEL